MGLAGCPSDFVQSTSLCIVGMPLSPESSKNHKELQTETAKYEANLRGM